MRPENVLCVLSMIILLISFAFSVVRLSGKCDFVWGAKLMGVSQDGPPQYILGCAVKSEGEFFIPVS